MHAMWCAGKGLSKKALSKCQQLNDVRPLTSDAAGGTARAGGGGAEEGSGNDERLPVSYARVVEAFRILTEMHQALLKSKHPEALTVASICQYGSGCGGVLCRRTLRQMVAVCPDLFLLAPGVNPTDESAVTLQLRQPTPPALPHPSLPQASLPQAPNPGEHEEAPVGSTGTGTGRGGVWAAGGKDGAAAAASGSRRTKRKLHETLALHLQHWKLGHDMLSRALVSLARRGRRSSETGEQSSGGGGVVEAARGRAETGVRQREGEAEGEGGGRGREREREK